MAAIGRRVGMKEWQGAAQAAPRKFELDRLRPMTKAPALQASRPRQAGSAG